jgi:hypothetical protein
MRRLTVYAKEAQLQIEIIRFYVLKWGLHALLKYILISFDSLAAILELYDICVRRIKITRIMFGMRIGKKPPQTDVSG